jgi:hypothetical protein
MPNVSSGEVKSKIEEACGGALKWMRGASAYGHDGTVDLYGNVRFLA